MLMAASLDYCMATKPKINKNNIALWNKAGPPSVQLWHHQHKGWRLRTTGSDHQPRLLQLTTSVAWGWLWQLLRSDAKVLIFESYFYMKPEYLARGRSECGNRKQCSAKFCI